MDQTPTFDDHWAAVGAQLLMSEFDSGAERAHQLSAATARLLPEVVREEESGAAERVQEHHRALDELAAVSAGAGGRVMTHRSPWSQELSAIKDRLDLTPYLHWPRLYLKGTSDYRWGWTWRTSLELQPTTDLLQNVLQQSASYDVATGKVFVEHRLSDHESEVKAFVGFPFVPSVSVGYINVRPYYQFGVDGYVDVDGSGAWSSSADRARSYTYAQIYVTSTDASGGDARFEGPVWSRSSYDHAGPGVGSSFSHSGVLTVGDGLVIDALVISARRYVVWVGCYAWAWSKIIPRVATSQVQAKIDGSVPFVVVEERPL